MPVPLPRDDQALLLPPDADEVQLVTRGVLSAVGGGAMASPLQQVLVSSLFTAMTGHEPDVSAAAPLSPERLARALARRTEQYRRRILQVMALTALVVDPVPPEVAERLTAYADALSVHDDLLIAAQDLSTHSRALLQVDFDRNGYLQQVADSRNTPAAEDGGVWGLAEDDPALAARWASLGALPTDAIGRRVHDFYLARGFEFPGAPGSAPPLLAQHDWVHVLADYGTTVESELEVFGFIARANDDPRALSLLAMVVSLFETGALAHGAGLFEADTGHLSKAGMAARLADAMRRGALCRGSNDFLAMDWFAVADRPTEVLRRELDLAPKAARVVSVGSVGPWQAGGISPYQLAAGRDKALREDRDYNSFGAAPE
ncbi:MAG: hypothetical protein ACRCYU_19020 [Nocardioides sp.]